MTRRRALTIAVLVLLAFGLSLWAERAKQPASTVPSIENPGPKGLKALATYLAERGHPVRAWSRRLTELPPEVKVLVIAAPTARKIDREEVDALGDFVTRGGTLVYLASAPSLEAQPLLAAALDLRAGPSVDRDPIEGDPSGSTATVTVSAGALEGVTSLRISSWSSLRSEHPGALPVATSHGHPWALVRRSGSGEQWTFAGPDVAENRRLELLDNLRLWENLSARGPIAFDEWHHHPAPIAPMSNALYAVLAQGLLCAIAFALSRQRLGPAREIPFERQRSIREYLEAFAALTRRARIEPQLVGEELARLRLALHERAGIPISVSAEEAARSDAALRGVSPDELHALLLDLEAAARAPRLSPHEYRALMSRTSAFLD